MTSWVRQGILQRLLFRQNSGEVKPKKTIASLFPSTRRLPWHRVRGGEALCRTPAGGASLISGGRSHGVRVTRWR